MGADKQGWCVQVLWLLTFLGMRHCWLLNSFLPSTGSWRMLECQVCCACLGSPYSPLPTVCFTHWHHMLRVQVKCVFQGPAPRPISYHCDQQKLLREGSAHTHLLQEMDKSHEMKRTSLCRPTHLSKTTAIVGVKIFELFTIAGHISKKNVVGIGSTAILEKTLA